MISLLCTDLGNGEEYFAWDGPVDRSAEQAG
jgi:hypothetical protein